MLHRFASIRGFVTALFLGLSMVAPQAADPKITLMEGTDLPGFDYAITKDTDIDACSTSCVDDAICRAFTFNTQTRWCFLKGTVGEETAFGGAISGRVSRAPSPAVIEASRQAELPFPGNRWSTMPSVWQPSCRRAMRRHQNRSMPIWSLRETTRWLPATMLPPL